jgi:hypothetical protein
LLHNALFFVVGVRLHRWRHNLVEFASRGWTYLALTVPVFACRALLVQGALSLALDGVSSLALAASGGRFCWLLTFGFLGLALGMLNRPQPALFYLADSSYWVYLTHLPIVGLLQVDLHPLPILAAGKFLIVLSVTMALTLGSYQVMVRHTFLGVWLHGKRDRARSLIPSQPHFPLAVLRRSFSDRRNSTGQGSNASRSSDVWTPHGQGDNQGKPSAE